MLVEDMDLFTSNWSQAAAECYFAPLGKNIIYIYDMYNIYIHIMYIHNMSHRKNPGNTKYVLDGHWFMEIDGNC